MARWILVLSLIAVLGICVFPVQADDKPSVEKAPPPRIIPPPANRVPFEIITHPAYYYRPAPSDVWQLYAVDRQGFFRARVIYGHYGAYYLYNGRPFYTAPVQPELFMPYAVN